MKRNAINQLIKWKNTKTHKPLIVQGARQVGKTWLMQEFGKTQYEQVAYINFDEPKNCEIFEDDYDISRIVMLIEIETGIKINPENTLIILDEIQECPRA